MAKRREAWYILWIMVTVFWTLLAGANVSAEPGLASPSSGCEALAQGPQGALKDKGWDEKVLATTVLEPESLRAIIGSVDTPGTAGGVAVIGEKAYVADGLWGLQVVDVSDPRDPTIIGSVDTPGTAGGVAVIGEKAYVADGLWG
ncbi:MAG: hypothetical protein SWE60_27010, partial [Thermodesulfobacteriota bacterium]|nr:hypothetical protein [Thermodesulfobacteriota bacterium]